MSVSLLSSIWCCVVTWCKSVVNKQHHTSCVVIHRYTSSYNYHIVLNVVIYIVCFHKSHNASPCLNTIAYHLSACAKLYLKSCYTMCVACIMQWCYVVLFVSSGWCDELLLALPRGVITSFMCDLLHDTSCEILQ